MLTHKKRKLSGKVWIECDGKPVLGKGGAQILEEITRANSLSRAALTLGMSYRYVWNYVREMEKTVGEPIVETYRGGKSGGGWAKLTETGRSLLSEYKKLDRLLSEFLSDPNHREVICLKISARNRLKGKVVSVEKDRITGKVKMEIRVPAIITAVITREAIEELDIKVGDEVEAIVKSTEVMIGK
jgi:molybdate transport system regulatory protein